MRLILLFHTDDDERSSASWSLDSVMCYYKYIGRMYNNIIVIRLSLHFIVVLQSNELALCPTAFTGYVISVVVRISVSLLMLLIFFLSSLWSCEYYCIRSLDELGNVSSDGNSNSNEQLSCEYGSLNSLKRLAGHML